jgi:hypothetical protein
MDGNPADVQARILNNVVEQQLNRVPLATGQYLDFDPITDLMTRAPAPGIGTLGFDEQNGAILKDEDTLSQHEDISVDGLPGINFLDVDFIGALSIHSPNDLSPERIAEFDVYLQELHPIGEFTKPTRIVQHIPTHSNGLYMLMGGDASNCKFYKVAVPVFEAGEIPFFGNCSIAFMAGERTHDDMLNIAHTLSATAWKRVVSLKAHPLSFDRQKPEMKFTTLTPAATGEKHKAEWSLYCTHLLQCCFEWNNHRDDTVRVLVQTYNQKKKVSKRERVDVTFGEIPADAFVNATTSLIESAVPAFLSGTFGHRDFCLGGVMFGLGVEPVLQRQDLRLTMKQFTDLSAYFHSYQEQSDFNYLGLASFVGYTGKGLIMNNGDEENPTAWCGLTAYCKQVREAQTQQKKYGKWTEKSREINQHITGEKSGEYLTEVAGIADLFFANYQDIAYNQIRMEIAFLDRTENDSDPATLVSATLADILNDGLNAHRLTDLEEMVHDFLSMTKRFLFGSHNTYRRVREDRHQWLPFTRIICRCLFDGSIDLHVRRGLLVGNGHLMNVPQSRLRFWQGRSWTARGNQVPAHFFPPLVPGDGPNLAYDILQKVRRDSRAERSLTSIAMNARKTISPYLMTPAEKGGFIRAGLSDITRAIIRVYLGLFRVYLGFI